jgi:hypothetical protein
VIRVIREIRVIRVIREIRVIRVITVIRVSGCLLTTNLLTVQIGREDYHI